MQKKNYIQSTNQNYSNKNVLNNIRKVNSNNQTQLSQNIKKSNSANQNNNISNKEILNNIYSITNSKHLQHSRQKQVQDSHSSSNENDSFSFQSKKEEKSGWCYITTAVCTALNKSDDCDELMAFRKFRDTMKVQDCYIATLINEYYRVAPIIVSAINNEKNSVDIYKNIWYSYLSHIYNYIIKCEYKSAVNDYIKLTVMLCNKYKISFPQSIKDILYSFYL